MSFWKSISSAIPAITSGAGSLFGSESEVSSAKDTNEQNYRIAKENREWQEKMSNTAHQREVKDLISAGLNPILSAKYGGASTPPGNTASMLNARAGTGDRMRAMAQSLAQVRLINAQAKAIEQTVNIKKPSEQLAQNVSQTAKGFRKGWKDTKNYFAGFKYPIKSAYKYAKNEITNWNTPRRKEIPLNIR